MLHATDEVVTEFAIEPFAAGAPLHVAALRTASAKYSSYTNWSDEGIAPQLAGEENELYDYATEGGRLELHNRAGESPLEPGLRATLQHAVRHELRAPLPQRLLGAHARGYADYFTVARIAARNSATRRREREERQLGATAAKTGEHASTRRRARSASARPVRIR